MFKFARTSAALILLTSISAHADICKRESGAELKRYQDFQAKVEGIARKLKLNYTSAFVAECNPKSIIQLAYPNTPLGQPGSQDAGIRMANICAPTFSFSTQDEMQAFATKMKYVLSANELDYLCVQQDFVRPRH